VVAGTALAGLAGIGSAWAAEHVRSGRRIVGGTVATQGQFPFMAFVAYLNSSGNLVFICSGTLVSSNLVLTAGHCTVNETTGALNRASGYRVVTGTVDWAQPPRTISRVPRSGSIPTTTPRGPSTMPACWFSPHR
jgi:secreted trypsin-like serine protease